MMGSAEEFEYLMGRDEVYYYANEEGLIIYNQYKASFWLMYDDVVVCGLNAFFSQENIYCYFI